MNAITNVNGYKIAYNDFWKMYQVSHENIGACIAEFKTMGQAMDYCLNG